MRTMWLAKVVTIVIAAGVTQGCMVRAKDYKVLQNRLAETEATVEGYQKTTSAQATQLDDMRGRLDVAQKKVEEERARREAGGITKPSPELAAIWERLERLAEGRKDLKWDAKSRRLLVSVDFDLGSASIKPSGKSSIKDVAGVLRNLSPDYRIYVDGHTDNLPVVNPTTVEKYKDNRGLSAARALAVSRLLDESGAPGRLLIERGFGEFCPIASNDSEEGRSRNRRVEISVIPAPAAMTHAAAAPESVPDREDETALK